MKKKKGGLLQKKNFYNKKKKWKRERGALGFHGKEMKENQ